MLLAFTKAGLDFLWKSRQKNNKGGWSYLFFVINLKCGYWECKYIDLEVEGSKCVMHNGTFLAEH